MKNIKSERLKKLETELQDLEQWLKLGLVPKKDLERHKEEIQAILGKIEEEKERLKFLKESGEAEEYVTPKRTASRTAYTEMPTIPDIELGESSALTEADFDVEGDDDEEEGQTEAEGDETEAGVKEKGDDEDAEKEEDEEESYFSDRSRWRRGGIIDPEANEW